MYAKNYWSEAKKKQIVAQIGDHEYEKVKASDYRTIPCAMSPMCGGGRKNSDTLNAKMSKLVMYHIATFDHITNGHTEKNAVVRIPYEENSQWDLNATWDTVYFILPLDCLKPYSASYKPKSPPAVSSFPQVRVKSWKRVQLRSDQNVILSNEDIMDQVTRQIGTEKSIIPSVFYIKPEYPAAFEVSQYKDPSAFFESLAPLKVYKVASYAAKGASGKDERFVIVRIPYEENKSWNANAKWDTSKQNTLFAILPEKDVEIVKGEYLSQLARRH
jgi:hypothetical protein